MAPTTLAKIAIRLVSIYLISQCVVFLPNVLPLLGMGESAGSAQALVFWVILVPALPFLMGIVLWIGAPRLSKLVVGPSRDQDSAASPTELQAIAIATAGLILLFAAIPRLASSFYVAVIAAPQLDGVRYYGDGPMGVLIGAVLQVLFAVALILGAKFWARALWRVRSLGVHDSTSNNRVESDA